MAASSLADRRRIWTIGHSTFAAADVLATLQGADVELLVDVRSQPGSRHNPQFGSQTMQAWLADGGIDYLHLPELGGRRNKQAVNPEINAGWHLAAFKNYADYTLTPGFADGLGRLTELALHRHVAIMCAEATPWRCHRLLLANILTTQGWQVIHLITHGKPIVHELGAWGARPEIHGDGTLTYPAE